MPGAECVSAAIGSSPSPGRGGRAWRREAGVCAGRLVPDPSPLRAGRSRRPRVEAPRRSLGVWFHRHPAPLAAAQGRECESPQRQPHSPAQGGVRCEAAPWHPRLGSARPWWILYPTAKSKPVQRSSRN